MELISFIFLIFIGALTLISENKYVLKYIYIPYLFLFMIVVRNSGFDVDIAAYVSLMKSSINTLYIRKEFMFWYPLRLLYFIFQDPKIVFLIMDAIWIFILFRTAIQNVNLQKDRFSVGLLVVLSSSFPFFFGYENIYRQLLATVFALYSYSLINSRYKTSILLFVIAIFMHNTVLILLPLFFVNKLLKFKIKFRVFIALVLSIAIIFLLNYLSQFKSFISIGLDMSIFYLILFIIIIMIYLIKFKFKIFDLFRKTPSLIIIMTLMLGVYLLQYETISERLGMMFLVFLLFDLYRYSHTIEHYGYRVMFRLVLLFVFSLPVLVFSSSLMFLI